jgi:hypothetical protein
MAMTNRILIQTTIPFTADDWHVGRFARLADHLASTPGVDVTTRNLERGADGIDRTLAGLGDSEFDELWLFAVDMGDGLAAAECVGIGDFARRGGGVLTARDHQDLGCSLAGLPGVGSAHHFHTINPDPRIENRLVDDLETASIVWPNYHSGRNGDVQRIEAVAAGHPLLRREEAPGGVVARLPAHPHEGSIGVSADDPAARVIARGRSAISGRPFNLIIAGETSDHRWIAESSFHHFADYNWEPAAGAPSFVTEPVGDAIARDPSLLDDVRAYVDNAAAWLRRAE